MREILFRGKSKTTGEWFYGNLFVEDAKGRTHVGITTKACFNIDPETVGQYTGMADKNGTNIFEGDIVRESFKGHGRIYHVFWDDDYFAFRAKGEDITYQLDEISPSHCEVIGNIHDNKELLK